MGLKIGQPWDSTSPTSADVGTYLVPKTSTIPSGSAVSLTTATAATVTSVVLNPGIYAVWGNVDFTLTAATTTAVVGCLSLTTNTLSTQAGGSGLGTDPLAQQLLVLTTTTGTTSIDVGITTLAISAQTTLYLVAQATFSAGTVAAYGTLFAQAI